jgi:hypothetical protein
MWVKGVPLSNIARERRSNKDLFQTQTRDCMVCIVLTVQYMAEITKEWYWKPASGSLALDISSPGDCPNRTLTRACHSRDPPQNADERRNSILLGNLESAKVQLEGSIMKHAPTWMVLGSTHQKQETNKSILIVFLGSWSSSDTRSLSLLRSIPHPHPL